MVTDPNVTKVIVISDKAYAEKADARKGGVGTESQIIAAYSVVASCVAQTQKLKAFQAGHDLRSVPQMQAYWAEQEQADLQHAKQMVALLRTN